MQERKRKGKMEHHSTPKARLRKKERQKNINFTNVKYKCGLSMKIKQSARSICFTKSRARKELLSQNDKVPEMAIPSKGSQRMTRLRCKHDESFYTSCLFRVSVAFPFRRRRHPQNSHLRGSARRLF